MTGTLQTQAERAEEARRFVRRTAEEFGLPESLVEGWMRTGLEERGLPPLMEPPFNHDPTLPLGWDDEEWPGALPFGLVAPTEVEMISIIAEADGAVKILKRGHAAVEESLDRLGNSALANAIREFVAASQSLEAAEKEKDRLESGLKNLQQLVADEPALITHEIKQAFPEGTAGKTVDILPRNSDPDDTRYTLYVNELPQGIAVDEKFGRSIVVRKALLKINQADIATNAKRLAELKLKISDMSQALPALERRFLYFFKDQKGRAELDQSLGGNFKGVTVGDQGQPVAVVGRKVNEELSEAPDDLKRWLVARVLAGEELPEKIQEALGIREAILAAEKALNAPPKTAPQPEANPAGLLAARKASSAAKTAAAKTAAKFKAGAARTGRDRKLNW